MAPRDPERNGGGVKVLEKGLAVLGLFDELKPEWGASEVAKQLGGSVASAHRMLHTLAAAGYLTQLPGGRFSLGEASLVLGRKAQRAMDIGALLRPDLQELSEAIGETTIVATRGDEPGYLVCTEVVESASSLRIAPAIGVRISLTESAIGKAYLAHLGAGEREAAIKAALDQAPAGASKDEIRASIEADIAVVEEQQYARSQDDDEAGVWEVASPIRASDGAPIAVIAVSGPMFPKSRRPDREMGPIVVAAATKAEARISNWRRGVRLGHVRESMGANPQGGSATAARRFAGGQSGAGGVLKIGHTVAIETLNPLEGLNISTMKVLAAVYPMLVNQAPDGEIVGDFAKGWTRGDEKSITFVTHDDGKWTDGEPLTAHDAAFTLELLRSGQVEGFRSLVVGIESATALDDTTIRVTYVEATATALLNLAHIPILPRHIYAPLLDDPAAGLDDLGAQAVTAGPFRVAHYEDGFLLLERHEQAYGPKPEVDRIAWTHYRSDENMVADLRSGVIDAIDDPSGIPADFESLRRDPSVVSWRSDGSAMWYVGFNSNPAKEKNRELLLPGVRRALSMAIDRDRIVREVLGGMGEPAGTIVPPVLDEWRGDGTAGPGFDPAEAERLLDGAGFSRGDDGIRVTDEGSMRYLVQVSIDIPAYHRVFQIIREGWREIGVEVTPEFLDSTPMNEAVMGPGKSYQGCDIFLWCWVLTILDPQAVFRVLVSGELGALNDSGFEDAEFDELYRCQALATDVGERMETVRAMEALVSARLPYVPLCFVDSVGAHRSEWSGLPQGPLGSFPASSKSPYLTAGRARGPDSGRAGTSRQPARSN